MGIFFFRDRSGQCSSLQQAAWRTYCFHDDSETTETTGGRIRWVLVMFCCLFTQRLKALRSPSAFIPSAILMLWNPTERPNSRIRTSMEIGDQVEDQHHHTSLVQENPQRWEASPILEISMWLTDFKLIIGEWNWGRLNRTRLTWILQRWAASEHW